MEGDAVGVEAKIAGSAQEFDRHIGCAAEFSRQWPLRTLAGNEDATEDLRAGRRTRELVEFKSAIEGEQPQTGPIGKGDVFFFFYSVAKG